MADFGGFFIGEGGTLLVTPDTPCYELVGDFSAASRSGNVNTYNVNTPEYPLVFVRCGTGQAAGLLAVEGSSGAWRVSVLSTVRATIQVFVPLRAAPKVGHGLMTFAPNGSPVFSSLRPVLNVRDVGALTEFSSFPLRAPLDMVSYTSGPVRPNATTVDSVETVGSFRYTDVRYTCIQQGFNQFGGPNYVCGYQNVIITVFVYARIRTTNWTIDRGVARVNSAGTAVGFDWLLHKSGFYKQILSYFASSWSGSTGPNGAPLGYAVPQSFIDSVITNVSGELSITNAYPYTSSRANMGAQICLASNRSDYG